MIGFMVSHEPPNRMLGFSHTADIDHVDDATDPEAAQHESLRELRKQIAHYYGDSEDHVAFFWNSARDKELTLNHCAEF